MNVNHATCIPMHVSPKIQTKLGPIHHNIAHCATYGLKPPQGPYNLLELNLSFFLFLRSSLFLPIVCSPGEWGTGLQAIFISRNVYFHKLKNTVILSVE